MSDKDRENLFKLYKIVGGTKVWQLKNAVDTSPFFFASGMIIDVDGAPNAYAPIGTVGPLDYLNNANTKPKTMKGSWCGIVTDAKGNPIQQNAYQPYPGYYISKTSLVDNRFTERDPSHFVDATKVPYIALPPSYFHSSGLKLGDFALIINGNNGKSCFAIFADTKYAASLGEVSARVAELLSLPFDLRWQQKRKAGDKNAQPPGGSSGIISLVFPGSGPILEHGNGDRILDESEIQDFGKVCLHRFSILDPDDTFTLSFSKEYPNFTKALERNGYTFTCHEKQNISSMMLDQWSGANNKTK
jgi:hypothetical protein